MSNIAITSSWEELEEETPRPKNVASVAHRPVAIVGGTADGVRDYLQQIGKFPLLAAEEEITLAKRIEVGLVAQERLSTDGALAPSMKRILQQLVHEGDAAYQRFICCNLKLVVSVAKHYSGRGVPLLDLIQDGNLGLDRAVKKFDYKQGFKFSTYAMWWIRQAISRSLADTASLIRVPVHTAEKINTLNRLRRELLVTLGREATVEELADVMNLDDVTVRRLLDVNHEPVSLHTPTGDDATNELGDLIEDGDAAPIIDIVTIDVRDEDLRARIDALPAREAEILKYRYGLGGESPKTFDQVGTILGVSRERVRQLEVRALKLLRCPELHEYLEG